MNRTRVLSPLRWALGLLAASFGPALAQQGSVIGRVIDEGGAPLSGAQVVVENTRLGGLSNAEGRYTILNVPVGTVTVRVIRLGYTDVTRSVTVREGAAAVADFQLKSQAIALQELVVVGYTTQTQRSVSGSVTSLQTASLTARKVTSLEDAIKGRAPGVTMITSGNPGQAAQVNIRGQNFLANVQPLYIVDGMYMQQNPNLNPNDVASIQILKDASAASQYGAQAANGVVVITTKKGAAGRGNQMQLHSYYGWQKFGNRPELMNAKEWAAVTKMAFENAKAQDPNSAAVPQGILDVLSGKNTTDTDWQAALMRNGAIQDHALSMSGGNESANYYLSGGFSKQIGTIINTSFNRYTLRANSQMTHGRLTVGENLSVARSDRRLMPSGALNQATRLVPAIPVRDTLNNATGGWGYGSPAIPTFGSNPVGTLTLNENTIQSNELVGTVFGQFSLLQDFNYRLNVGFNNNTSYNHNFVKKGVTIQNTPLGLASLTATTTRFQSLLVENLLSLNRRFGPHHVNATGGYTAQNTQIDMTQAYRQGFADENLQQINAGTLNLNNAGSLNQSVLHSLLTRVAYDYSGRYVAEFSARRDGSSRFGSKNRWGNFFAGSLGWVVSDEGFFQNIPLLGRANFLKLRGSYGTLGNQDFSNYQYAASIAANQSYMFGGQVATGGIQTSLANEDIKWQENTMQNYGFDMNLLHNALSFTFDYYRSRSDDLLVQAPLPYSIGSATAPYVNAGSVQNTGMELSATHKWQRGDFQLNTTANATSTRNKVLSLGNGAQPIYGGGSGGATGGADNVARTAVGQPMGQFWVRHMIGVFQTADDVAAYKNSKGKVIQPNARPGDPKWADINDDGTIDANDRSAAGDPWPEWEFGLFMDGSYRSWSFSVGVHSAIGFEIFNSIRYAGDRGDDVNNITKGYTPWTPENHSTTTPRIVYGALGADIGRVDSDRWVESGDYLKVQNIQVGYELPLRYFEKLGLNASRANLYVNLQNPFTLTKYKGYDPEFVGNGGTDASYTLARGVDQGMVYPNPRTLTFGVDISF